MATKVSFDKNKVKKDIELRMIPVQKRLDAQVMKDSNYFIPKDTGALEKSVLGSVLGSGLLTWAIDYAKKMYNFGGKPSKETNPNASVKWFERAKVKNKEAWARMVNDEYRK